jgi:hypothetical protein
LFFAWRQHREFPQSFGVAIWHGVEQVLDSEMASRGRELVLSDLRDQPDRDPDQNPLGRSNDDRRFLRSAGLTGKDQVEIWYHPGDDRLTLVPARFDPEEQAYGHFAQLAITLSAGCDDHEFKAALDESFRRGLEAHLPEEPQPSVLDRDLAQWLDQVRLQIRNGIYFPPSRANSPAFGLLISRLEDLGFFAYMRPDQVGLAKQIILETGDLRLEQSHRYYMVDAEDLAERGIRRFFKEIRGFLESLGLPPLALEEHLEHDQSYDVTIICSGGARTSRPCSRAEQCSPTRVGIREVAAQSWSSPAADCRPGGGGAARPLTCRVA